MERDITREQYSAVKDWIHSRDGRYYHSLDENIIGSGVYVVDEEPVVLHIGPNRNPLDGRLDFSLVCSDKHGQELIQTRVLPPILNESK